MVLPWMCNRYASIAATHGEDLSCREPRFIAQLRKVRATGRGDWTDNGLKALPLKSEF